MRFNPLFATLLCISAQAFAAQSWAALPTAPMDVSAHAKNAQVVEDAASELERIRAEQQNALQALNSLNPFSAEYGKSPQAGAPVSGPYAQLHQLLAQPGVQAYLKLVANPALSKAVGEVTQSPNRLLLLYAEIGFLIFMLVLRAWRLSLVSHWFKRALLRFSLFVSYAAGASFFVPWVVLGDPFLRSVVEIAQVIRGVIQG